MDFIEWQNKAIGVPFKAYGRDYDGWDCWGLVVSAYKDCLKIDLPDVNNYDIDDYRGVANLYGRRSNSLWRKSSLRPFAIAGIIKRRLVIHCGIVIDPYRIIHVEDGVDTCIQRIDQFQIDGFYEPSNSATTSI